MSIYETISVPLRYIDSLEKRQHILLFYENPDYARLIEFRFIKNGLTNGETCVYVTAEDSGVIVVKFLSYGIPLHYFQSGKLKVVQIHEVCGGRDEVMRQCRKDVSAILDSLIPPYRIVGRIVPNVSTMDGMSVQMELEKMTHNRFDDYRGSIMCTYDISQIERGRRRAWLEKLREHHHVVINTPRFGESGVFCPN